VGAFQYSYIGEISFLDIARLPMMEEEVEEGASLSTPITLLVSAAAISPAVLED
jgi:hypothetical protein